jgi:hypothetical protein
MALGIVAKPQGTSCGKNALEGFFVPSDGFIWPNKILIVGFLVPKELYRFYHL